MTRWQKFGAWAQVVLLFVLMAMFAWAGIGVLSACVAFPFTTTLAMVTVLWIIAACACYELAREKRKFRVGEKVEVFDPHLPPLRTILATPFYLLFGFLALPAVAVVWISGKAPRWMWPGFVVAMLCSMILWVPAVGFHFIGEHVRGT